MCANKIYSKANANDAFIDSFEFSSGSKLLLAYYFLVLCDDGLSRESSMVFTQVRSSNGIPLSHISISQLMRN